MKALIIVAVIVLVMATGLMAGINRDAKVAVHVLPYDCNRACSRNFPEIETPCDVINTYSGCGDIDFFPVFFDLVEYQGLEYGVEWPGSYSCVFISCSYTDIGDIVWPGDGITQAWRECHRNQIAVPGWGWITTDVPGKVCIVPHPVMGGIHVGDCSGVGDPDRLGYPGASFCAGVCGAEGEGPCGPIEQAVAATTWGSIKGMFR